MAGGTDKGRVTKHFLIMSNMDINCDTADSVESGPNPTLSTVQRSGVIRLKPQLLSNTSSLVQVAVRKVRPCATHEECVLSGTLWSQTFQRK